MTNMSIKTSEGAVYKTPLDKTYTHAEYDYSIYDPETDREYEVIGAITHYFKQKPIHNADNPDDYYGYTECDIEWFDPKGEHLAENVEEWISQGDYDKIQQMYEDSLEDAASDYGDYVYDEYKELASGSDFY